VTQKKVDDGEIENNTGTDLQILQNIEKAFYRNNEGAMRRNTEKSMKWFSRYVPRSFNRVRKAQLARDRSLFTGEPVLGQMMTFTYDAKTKDELPVWDAQPLVFFFGTYRAKDGTRMMQGINLHYLKPEHRLIAFQALLKLRTEKRYRASTRLKLTWQLLSGMSQSKFFEHCVKQYREDHIRSQFIKIPSKSWEIVLFLPVARWQKGGARQAYKFTR
jgi:hypothetical protein